MAKLIEDPRPSLLGFKPMREDDLPYMRAVKLGMNPPIIKIGWLSGYYHSGVRG